MPLPGDGHTVIVDTMTRPIDEAPAGARPEGLTTAADDVNDEGNPAPVQLDLTDDNAYYAVTQALTDFAREQRGRAEDLAGYEDLDKHYDHVIVDAAGDDNQEMRTAMTRADLMIVVLRPSQLDVETLEEFTDVIDAAKDFNPGLQVRSLISQAPTNHNETETVDVGEFIVEFPQIKPLETVVYARKAYRDSLADGRGVIEVAGTAGRKARGEIQELVAEVYA